MVDEHLEFYWLPHCSTCQKAAAFLEQRGRAISIWRDLKAEPLTRTEVEGLAAKVGGASELFSRRARKYHAMGLHDKELSDADMLALMTEEYTFIKRPVLVENERAVAGFTPKTYEGFFEET